MAEPLLFPKQEAEPKFPQTHVGVSPAGVQIRLVLAPGSEYITTLNEETMNQVCAMWIQNRKDLADQMRVIEHVQRTKNN